jgi:hypothetical protein
MPNPNFAVSDIFPELPVVSVVPKVSIGCIFYPKKEEKIACIYHAGKGFKVIFSSDTVEVAVPYIVKDYRVKGLHNNFMCFICRMHAERMTVLM